MRIKIASTLLLLATVLPLSVLPARAYDEDIAAYAQELDWRIEQGRYSLNPTNYQNLRNIWNQVEMIRRQYMNRQMGANERNSMMASLMNIDRELTTNLHDTQFSHYQDWNPATKTWRQNWWSRTGQNYNYDSELDSYMRNLRDRLNRGRSSMSPGEYMRLQQMYANIDRMQLDSRRGGLSFSERNALMSSLTQLDRDLTRQLHDEDNARFHHWDGNNSTWNQQWWRSGWKNPGNPNPGWSKNPNSNIWKQGIPTRVDNTPRTYGWNPDQNKWSNQSGRNKPEPWYPTKDEYRRRADEQQQQTLEAREEKRRDVEQRRTDKDNRRDERRNSRDSVNTTTTSPLPTPQVTPPSAGNASGDSNQRERGAGRKRRGLE